MFSDDSSKFFFCAVDVDVNDATSKMSLFERKNEEDLRRRGLDESAELLAFITNTITVDSHTVFLTPSTFLLDRRNSANFIHCVLNRHC